jgi:hypothetical protein
VRTLTDVCACVCVCACPVPLAGAGASASASASGHASAAAASVAAGGAATGAGIDLAHHALPPGPLLLYPLASLPAADGGAGAGALPPVLEGIPLEQLRRMEGNERAAVEARLLFLRQVQAQIDGLIVALTQYQRMAAEGPAA